MENDSLRIDWDRPVRLHGGEEVAASTFPLAWLREHCYSVRGSGFEGPVKRELWRNGQTEVPVVQHEDWLNSDEGLQAGMEGLYTYGALIVRGTPTSYDGTQAAVERIGIPRASFYGTMWDTAPKAEGAVNDTAYTNMELKPHNDCCYLHDPPAIQVFNCAEQSAEGGQTWLVDAFAVAEALKEQDPAAFNFFTTTPIPSQSIDDTHDVHVRSNEPIISLDGNGRISRVRLNNDDRACLQGLSADKVEQFYEFIPKLLTLTRDSAYACNVLLGIGDMLIVENRRVMHGRREFQGFRNLVGCYMDADMYESRLRKLNIIE